ncbi:MAG: hypothetical protein ACK5MW_02285 [Enterococcus sp.]
MTKYIIEILEGQQFTAGSKAKEDIVNFLQHNGFDKLGIQVPDSNLKRLLSGNHQWKKALNILQPNDIVFYQYPAYSRLLGDFFLKQINKKSPVKKILILHDVDSLRHYQGSPKDIQRELNFFNSFDAIIAHNQKMKTWLTQNHVFPPIICLELFDYQEDAAVHEADKSLPILFAGNLGKSQFLEKLNIATPLNLFGINQAEFYPENINYLGSYPSNELGEKLLGSFGLVWDGDSIQECNGVAGEYMKFNNPHKTSLYLTLGIPVIIWDKAALGDFVTKHNVGIVIDDLSKLDHTLQDLSETDYQVIKQNAIALSKKIRSGHFIKHAVREAIDQIEHTG